MQASYAYWVDLFKQVKTFMYSVWFFPQAFDVERIDLSFIQCIFSQVTLIYGLTAWVYKSKPIFLNDNLKKIKDIRCID